MHPSEVIPPARPSAPTSLKLGLRAPPGVRAAASRLADEFAGLDRLDREELDEDYVPPSMPSRGRAA